MEIFTEKQNFTENPWVGKSQDDTSILWELLKRFFDIFPFCDGHFLCLTQVRGGEIWGWAWKLKPRVKDKFSSRLDEVYTSDQREKKQG